MKAEHLNSFIQGAQNILATICGETVGLGKLFLKQPPYQGEDISVLIGIVGDLTGDVIFTMRKNTAVFLASRFMAGMDESMVLSMWESAVSEVMNMISGHVATIFFGNGTTIDITTPTLVTEHHPSMFAFIKDGSKLVCMPLIFASGDVFEIDVLLS